MALGIGVVAGVVLIGPLELKAFWASSVVGILIFAIHLSDTRKSNRAINSKIETVLDTVKEIKEKVDKLSNNSGSTTK